jgi:hypothetical protein
LLTRALPNDGSDDGAKRRRSDQREDRPKAGTELFCDLEEQKAEKQEADRREGAPK